MAKDETYKAIPELALYIDRISAEQLNFRRFIVKEYSGSYYTERAIIRISGEGNVTCSDGDYAPTELEAEAIKRAYQRADLPKSIEAPSAQLTALQRLLKGRHWAMWSRASGNIRMVQERRDNEDGSKDYIPWSFWSDGQWRAMEPDSALPFYKPRKKVSTRIMIHEGAKAAEAAASVDKKHPWAKTLAQYEHWGMLGGALAPHRADYSELEREKPTEVIYVCDADWPGRNALQHVSKGWGRAMKGIRFGEEWPTGWDIADPLPEHLYKDKLWCGGDLLDYAVPATRATRMEKSPETGRLNTYLLSEFAQEWYHSVETEFFVNKGVPDKLYTANEFNSLVRPYSDAIDTAALVRKNGANKANSIEYRPDRPAGMRSERNALIINTHIPSALRAVEGDPKPWLDYMAHLVPIAKDRTELLRWVATLIAKPGTRMSYSVLLISEKHGVGKTTLGEKILAPILGRSNCSFPRERDIVSSDFNSWLARKRLIVVNEIYAGHSSRAYQELKSVVADKQIQVNEKYMPTYTIENWAHVLASSNSLRALRLEDDDRRWLVPRVTEKLKPHAYWLALHQWLGQDGLGIIIDWAQKAVAKKGFAVRDGEHAPSTEAKAEVVAEGDSPGQVLVRELLDKVKQTVNWEKVEEAPFFLDTDLQQVIKLKIHQGRESPHLERLTTIRRVLRRKSWFYGGHNSGCKAWNMGPDRSRIVSPEKWVASQSPAKLAKLGKKPLDIKEFLDF